MFKVKVLMLGPCCSGKSTIANFLADATENVGGEYHPTQGVRILEFESPNLNVNNKYVKAEVELWDCSGDHRFEACWPALQRDAHGVIFVYNPDEDGHAKELEMLYNYFVTQAALQYQNCVVFAHYKPTTSDKYTEKLSSTFSRVNQVEINMDEDGNRARVDFNNFLTIVVGNMRERREQEELNLMNIRT